MHTQLKEFPLILSGLVTIDSFVKVICEGKKKRLAKRYFFILNRKIKNQQLNCIIYADLGCSLVGRCITGPYGEDCGMYTYICIHAHIHIHIHIHIQIYSS